MCLTQIRLNAAATLLGSIRTDRASRDNQRALIVKTTAPAAGRCVAIEGAMVNREVIDCPDSAAIASRGGVVRKVRVNDKDIAQVIESATRSHCRVAQEGRARNQGRRILIDVDRAAAYIGMIIHERAIGHRHHAGVVNRAATLSDSVVVRQYAVIQRQPARRSLPQVYCQLQPSAQLSCRRWMSP